MNTRFVPIILALLILGGCKQAEVQQQQGKTSYNLLTLEQKSINTTVSYSASIKGKQDIEIFPQVGGYLSKVNINEGEEVKKGEVLFVIEQTPFIASLEAAKASVKMSEAAVATAELNYNNTLTLRNKNIVSESDLQAKLNALANAEAQLSLAKAQEISSQTNLNFTVIKSPSNGVVGKLPYRQGALVSANLPQSLTMVSDNSEMFVYFSMNENQVLNLIDKYGSLDSVVVNMPQVELQLNNGTIYPHKGYVESISGIIENSTGAVSFRAVFPNEKRKLLSGGAGNVLITETHINTIFIPKAATFELQNKIFVYKVVDNKAKSTPIEVAKNSTDKDYIVTSGLSVGDVIIAEGAGLVREGTPVNQ